MRYLACHDFRLLMTGALIVMTVHLARPLAVEGETSTPEDLRQLQVRRITAEVEKPAGEAYDSGLEGTTSFIVVSGVPGGTNRGGPASIEFAIAPIEGGQAAYVKAVFVWSDRDGRYRVALPPGKYWIGPKAKALNPTRYFPRAVVFREQEAVVTEGAFTRLDLLQVGYAP